MSPCGPRVCFHKQGQVEKRRAAQVRDKGGNRTLSPELSDAFKSVIHQRGSYRTGAQDSPVSRLGPERTEVHSVHQSSIAFSMVEERKVTTNGMV